jgi:hypothetical protein
MNNPRKPAERVKAHWLPPAARARIVFLTGSWGSRPRLYAGACSAGSQRGFMSAPASQALMRQQEHRERGEPVLTGVITTRNVRESSSSVFVRRRRENFSRRITRRQTSRDTSHTPRAAQIQTIEMHELGICSIRNFGRLQ